MLLCLRINKYPIELNWIEYYFGFIIIIKFDDLEQTIKIIKTWDICKCKLRFSSIPSKL